MKKTERMELRVTKEQKKFIKNKSKKMGFGSITAFLIENGQKKKGMRIQPFIPSVKPSVESVNMGS